MVTSDTQLMRFALEAGWRHQGLTYPNPAVGAAVAYKGRFICAEGHPEAGAPHAEVLALKSAYLLLSSDTDAKTELSLLTRSADIHAFLITHREDFFDDLEMAVTLEPCNHYGRTPPCALLLEQLRPARVLIGVLDPTEASGGAARLRTAGIEVITGVCVLEAADLLEPFVRWNSGGFRLFKVAQSLNGVITGGIISGEASRDYVHALRHRVEIMAIGGNTVRTDRPILDARRVGGRAPDLLIYSRHDDFDRTIPLFGVERRQVWIEPTLQRLWQSRFALIEGGGGMAKATADLVDWYLIFVSSAFKEGEGYAFIKNCAILHTTKCGSDLMIWAKGKSHGQEG